MSQLIMSVSGLRGVVGQSLTPQVASRYAVAFVSQLTEPGPIVVTRDGRTSGPLLAEAIHTAVTSCGRNVLDGNVAATPTTGILVRQHRAAGGIQISASHNPAEYNGIKLFGPDGRVVNASLGAIIAQVYQTQSDINQHPERIGQVERLTDTTSQHLKLVLATVQSDAIRQSRFRVLLDANHGAGAQVGRALLESLQCELTVLGEEPSGKFVHPPEPTASHLAGVSAYVSNSNYDVAFCQDPDADRLAIIDERGQYIGEEFTLALTLENRLSQQAGVVVTNCSTSRMAMDIAAKYNSQCVTSAVGEANVADLMLVRQAIYGGEGNGGPIDPRVGLVRDSFVGMAQVLELMARRKQLISQLVSRLPIYHIVKSTIPIARENMGRLFGLIEAMALQSHEGQSHLVPPHESTSSAPASQPTISRLDGLRVDWPDRWILVRGSNTEPIVRVVAEARCVSDAQQLCEWVAGFATEFGDQA